MAVALRLVDRTSTDIKDCFEGARVKFEELIEVLSGPNTRSATHSAVEDQLFNEVFELGRQLLQGHMDVRGDGDVGEEVEGSDGVVRKKERRRSRKIESKFGTVEVNRLRSRPGTKCAFGRSQRWEGKEVDAGDAQHRRSRPTLPSRLWRCSNGQVVS